MTTRPLIIVPKALAPLTQEARWVVWKWVTSKTGKLTKPPYQGRSPQKLASSTKSATWCDLATCMRVYCEGGADGVGFALSGSDIGAFDIDDCRDATTEQIHPWALEQINLAGSYAEVTPSQMGVRIIGLARGEPLHRKLQVPGANGVSCELYRRADRYITITGEQIGKADALAEIDARLDAVEGELDSERKKAKGAKGAGESRGGAAGKPDLDTLIRDGEAGFYGGDRSRAVFAAIMGMLRRGDDDDAIVTTLINPQNGISAHVLDQGGDPEKVARRQIERARADHSPEDEEISRLARLKPVEYERERKKAAERIGVRAPILDRLVAAERVKQGLDDDGGGKQGHAIEFPEPEAWPDRVNGAALLDAIAAAVGSHVVMSEHQRVVAALWAVHTYLLDRLMVSPRLAICSPVKQCGKTTLLDVLARLVLRPLPTANVTAAAIFRVVEAYRPSLLVDEADTFLHESDELRGVVNSGHRAGGSVLRTVGDEHEVRSFATFSPCAIAAIGKLPDTLHDRSVVIDLKRRLASEKIAPFRSNRTAHLDDMARQIARWTCDNAERIGAADPEMPNGVHNRAADNWRPLLQIAEVAGGEWPERARKAAAGAAETVDDASRLELALADIRDVFASRKKNKVEPVDEIPSAALVEALVAIEGRPWAEMGRSGKPLTQNKLARLLKPLGIAPKFIGPKTNRARGYVLKAFTEAFERFLPPLGGLQPCTRAQCDEQGTSDISQPCTSDPGCTVEESKKSNNDGPVHGCTVAEGEIGEERWSGPLDTPELPHMECAGAEPGRGNSGDAGLPRHVIRRLAGWYEDAAADQYHATGDVDRQALDADLRRLLAEREAVFPEFIEVEFKRIMIAVFGS